MHKNSFFHYEVTLVIRLCSQNLYFVVTCSHYLATGLYITILFYLCLSPLNNLFPSGFLTNILHAFLISFMLVSSHTLDPPLFDHRNNIWRGIQIVMVINMDLFLASCSFPPLFGDTFSLATSLLFFH
jgi:hypothetical protein